MITTCILPDCFQIEATHFANIRSPAGWFVLITPLPAIRVLLPLMSHPAAENYIEIVASVESRWERQHLFSLELWWWSGIPVSRTCSGSCTQSLNYPVGLFADGWHTATRAAASHSGVKGSGFTIAGDLEGCRAVPDRALIVGGVMWYSRTSPCPRRTKKPTTDSWVSSLPRLLMAQGENGMTQLLQLETISKGQFKTILSRVRRKQTQQSLRARKHCEMTTVCSLQLLWVSSSNPQLQEKIMAAIQRAKSFCKGEETFINMHRFPCELSSLHRLRSEG